MPIDTGRTLFVLLSHLSLLYSQNVTCPAGHEPAANSTCAPCAVGTYRHPQAEACVTCPADEAGYVATTRGTGCHSAAACCYWKPFIKSMYPTYGPVSGNTLMRLDIAHLSNKTLVYVRLGDTTIDAVQGDRLNPRLLLFHTPPGNGSHHAVTVMLHDEEDEYVITAPGGGFSYRPDPVVLYLEDRPTILSGGIPISVHGEYLGSAQSHHMIVTRVVKGNATDFIVPCRLLSPEIMTCITPDMSSGADMSEFFSLQANLNRVAPRLGRLAREKRDTVGSNLTGPEPLNGEDLQFHVGYEFDGKQHRNQTTLPVYEDPIYYKFSENDKVRIYNPDSEDVVLIEGEGLNFGVRISDVNVTIGVDVCDVLFLASNTLSCRPPDQQPPPGPEGAGPGGTPMVIVHVGLRLKFIIGFLHYSTSTAIIDSDIVLRICVAVAAFLWLALMLILTTWCYKRRRKERKQIKTEDISLRYVTRPAIGGASAAGEGVSYAHVMGSSSGTSSSGQSTSDDTLSTHDTCSTDIVYAEIQTAGVTILDCLNLSEDIRVELRNCYVDSKRLSLGRIIGSGHFGRVVKGFLTDERYRGQTVVAVKVLKEPPVHGRGAHDEDLSSFMKEALMMRGLDHPNIVKLIGVALFHQTPHVILEYMDEGDLKAFLTKKGKTYSVGGLLTFASHVACGMLYLSNESVIHRDLAARNCMVNSSQEVKISDFGLSRDIHEKDYYRAQQSDRPLPVKWMAPESLETGLFSIKSDIWSFGIVVWEILTCGMTPYPDVDNFDVKRYINQGRRLGRPANCPQQVYNWLEECWDSDPVSRPHFDVLLQRLQSLLTENSEIHTREYLQIF